MPLYQWRVPGTQVGSSGFMSVSKQGRVASSGFLKEAMSVDIWSWSKTSIPASLFTWVSWIFCCMLDYCTAHETSIGGHQKILINSPILWWECGRLLDVAFALNYYLGIDQWASASEITCDHMLSDNISRQLVNLKYCAIIWEHKKCISASFWNTFLWLNFRKIPETSNKPLQRSHTLTVKYICIFRISGDFVLASLL